MKKLFIAIAMITALGLNAAAWFDGGLSATTGPSGYSRTDAYITIGGESIWVKPALMRQDADSLDKAFNTYSVRVGKESAVYTLAGEAGTTPSTQYSAASKYSSTFFGGDITFSLTPGKGGHGRMAGPNARAASGGGEGVTGVDVGAGVKHTDHKVDSTVAAQDGKTGQNELSLFAGAKILMVRLGASWTGFSYGSEKASAMVDPVAGLSYALLGVLPKSSVNVRLDIPATVPMIAPYVTYTTTKYKGGVDDSNAYAFGAYIDLNMIGDNVMYQIFDNGSHKNSYVTLNAGVKF